MFRIVVRRTLLLTAVPTIVLLGGAPAAVARTKAKAQTCDARSGTTVIEDAAVRVYTHHGLDYACARSKGASTELFRPDVKSEKPIAASGLELAGSYVGWSETDSFSKTETILVFNAAKRSIRMADSDALSGQNYTIGQYVLSPTGTAVFTENSSSCVSAGCSAQTKVIASSATRTYTLADASNNATGAAPRPVVPITELGLSEDGTYVYWLDNGKPAGASI